MPLIAHSPLRRVAALALAGAMLAAAMPARAQQQPPATQRAVPQALMPPVPAPALQVGRFLMVPDSRPGVVWRMDTLNGQVSWCEINKEEEGGEAQLVCHPRSPPM